MRLARHTVAFVAVISVLIVPSWALAQGYPSKPVRVVVPWPAGGLIDVSGRIVFQKISETLGQQFIIDNRPGATGSIGADLVAKSAPDGYTIMVHSTSHVSNPHIYNKLPYDTLKDFAQRQAPALAGGDLGYAAAAVSGYPDCGAGGRARV